MKLLSTLLLGSTFLAGSSVAVPAFGDNAPGAPNTMDGLQVAVGDCLVATPKKEATLTEKSFLDAIAGAVISQGVNYLGKALTAAGAAKTWTVTGARNIQATSAAFPQCVLAVRGSFVTSGGPATTWTPASGWPPDLSTKLANKGLWLSKAPDFIFEGEIVASSDQSALAIRPVIVSFIKPIGTRAFRWESERNVALFFAITPPGTKPTLDTAPAATIVLGKLMPSTTNRYDASREYSSPYESSWFTLTKADSVKPLTVTAMLSETQDEQAFLTFLGTIFSDPKVTAAATTQLTQLLIPSAAQQSALDATTKAASAASDADTKLGIAIAKLNLCKAAADASSAVATGAEARTALRNYMLADAALAAPRADVQQATIDMIDLRKPADAIKGGCVNVSAALAKP